jgi:hypothetical protein
MPRELSGFLREFIEMRKGLPKAPPLVTTAVSATGKDKKTKKAVGTKEGGLSLLQEGSVMRIIEEKPPKGEVKEYFQKMCDVLTAQKMDD